MEINVHAPHMHPDQEALRADVEHSLRHFADRLTRVDVFLKNANPAKHDKDMHCTIEARPRGMDPVAVDHHGTSQKDAVGGAAHKLDRRLDRVLGKHDKRRA